jgi:hypothetical protein
LILSNRIEILKYRVLITNRNHPLQFNSHAREDDHDSLFSRLVAEKIKEMKFSFSSFLSVFLAAKREQIGGEKTKFSKRRSSVPQRERERERDREGEKDEDITKNEEQGIAFQWGLVFLRRNRD